MAHSKGMVEGSCGGASWQSKYSGNKYRAKHDDGSKKSRKKAGPMSQKHHVGNPY